MYVNFNCSGSSVFHTPNDTKIDIEIRRFPFTQPGTKLALEAVMLSSDAQFSFNATGYFEEGDVILRRCWCGTFKRVVWYFEEGNVEL